LLNDIASLANGADRIFSFAEVKGHPTNSMHAPFVIRIDEFFEKRDRRALQEVIEASADRYFQGTALGAFDGILKAVDLPGDIKQAVLLLSAGGKQIGCVVNTIAITELGDALDQRIIAYGTAHYEKHSGPPIRLDIRKLDIVRPGKGLHRWRGAFDIRTDAHDRSGWDRK
jgi:hypothetical protein